MGSYKPSSFPNRDELPSGCFHSGNTCKACIGAYIASDIEGKFFDNVGCPNCMASWDRYYIELYSTKEVMMRYETIRDAKSCTSYAQLSVVSITEV